MTMTTTPWILTATGRDFHLSGLPTVMPDAAPRIEDIAHALAQINRYTGHAARPYSVHCRIGSSEIGSIAVPRGMVWVDEFDWVPVERAVAYSLTGALLVDVAPRLAGRPITLAGEVDAGWLGRSVVAQLHALAAQALGVPASAIAQLHVFKRSFDARRAGVQAVYIVDVQLADPGQEAALLAQHAQHPHIQGADIGPVSAYHRVINGRASVLDNADIGGGSSHLKIHAVGCP